MNESHSVVSHSLQPNGLYSPWNSPDQNNGMEPSLLQGVFPAQGLNPGLPHCRQILYQLSHRCICHLIEKLKAFIFVSLHLFLSQSTKLSEFRFPFSLLFFFFFNVPMISWFKELSLYFLVVALMITPNLLESNIFVLSKLVRGFPGGSDG